MNRSIIFHFRFSNILVLKVKNKLNFYHRKYSVGKISSFDFAEGLASCIGAKVNVPFVG